MEKKKIEKGSVQETLLLPLYGRKRAMEMYPGNFNDLDCQRIYNEVEIDYNRKGIMEKIGAIMAATRQYDLASVCRSYLKNHPRACVVNLGCGLDTTFSQVDNGQARAYNLDFPDAIAVRNELLGERERETNIACDLNDLSWFDKIDFRPEDGIVFFASGVFYYFKTEQVKTLFAAMAEHFPGGKLVFDATKKKGLKNMLKTWLKDCDDNIGVYFSVDELSELKSWSSSFSSVIRKGYLTGYRPLDKRYGFVGFGCELLAYDLYQNDEVKKIAKYVPLETLLAESDVITLHTNATEENHHLLNAEAFAKMKPGVTIVNTARGKLIDSDALLAALESGQVGAAGLDVLENENGLYYYDRMGDVIPNPELAALRAMPNVILTDHTAFYTYEDVKSMVRGVLESAAAFAEGSPTRHDVTNR